MNYSNYTSLVEVTRGPIVESVHFGAIAVVDSHGKLIASCGDPGTVTYMRSSSKPLQVIPFVESGGVEKYHLTPKELAILCASHNGTDDHVSVIEGIQKKTGAKETDLLCGTHPPSHQPTLEALRLRGEKPGPNRHNCSGKHNGFLAYALLRNLPIEDYINPEHPIQRTILETFSEMCSIDPKSVHIGVDGCSAPVFGLPLRDAALGYARLADPNALSIQRAKACMAITSAMAEFPVMVGGPGEFDTDLMQAAGGGIVTKTGAEGYQSVGILPGALKPGSPGIGISIKISDGDTLYRARNLVTLEVLRQLGYKFDPAREAALAGYGIHPVLNWRKIEVGMIQPCFKLEFPN